MPSSRLQTKQTQWHFGRFLFFLKLTEFCLDSMVSNFVFYGFSVCVNVCVSASVCVSHTFSLIISSVFFVWSYYSLFSFYLLHYYYFRCFLYFKERERNINILVSEKVERIWEYLGREHVNQNI